MNPMLKTFYAKPLAIYLTVALLAIATFSGPAEAMFVPAISHQNATDAAVVSGGRAEDLAKIQTALESKIVRQKLMDYGLSPEETMERVNKLSDDQLSQLATHTESLQAGGDPVDLVIGLMVIALLVVLLIFLLQGRIVVR
jgi:hypothetical protein